MMFMKEKNSLHVILVLTVLIGSTALLFGCGGGSGSGTTLAANGTSSSPNGPSSSSMISGMAVKGPVGGATVTAYGLSNGMMGAQLASGTTDSQGGFTMNINGYTGPLMLQMSGGTYTDEATGLTMTMAPGDVMTAVVSSSTGSMPSGIQITPLTSMAQDLAQHMTGGMTEANIAAANTAIGNYFMVSDILATKPMNPLVAGSGAGATQDMRNYGMVVAAMTQYANSVGMTDSSAIVTAMMQDASDGVMNGMMGSTPITMGGMGGGMMGGSMMSSTAGTSGLASAMSAFIGSTMNRSGLTLTDMQNLMNHLSTGSGQIQGTAGTGGTGTGTGGTMMSGTAYNGTMSSATVMAYGVSGGAMGAQLASGTTDSMGNFNLSLGSYSGPVMLKVTGGSYANLATGATMSMLSGDGMTAVTSSLASGATVTGISITPLTSMAQARAQYMAGGMTDSNITSANTAVGNYFIVSDILHTTPMNAAVSGSGGTATTDMRNYGMAVAAMSQYSDTAGMTDPAALITAMMQDASDGVMNGMMGSTPITMGGMGGGMMGGGSMMPSTAGTSGLAAAMSSFINNTSVNKSGLTTTSMQTLIDQLNASNGTIQ